MKALVIVDMQNDFVTGVLGTTEAQVVVPKIVEKLHSYADLNTVVLLTKDTHYENYLETEEGKHLPVPHCIEGTPGWSICGAISTQVDYGMHITYSSDDIVKSRIIKNTFGSVELAETLRDIHHAHGLEEIVFVGVCTGICVISNVLLTKAYLPEVPITVDASCCACVTPQSHKTALDAMRLCQINIEGE